MILFGVLYKKKILSKQRLFFCLSRKKSTSVLRNLIKRYIRIKFKEILKNNKNYIFIIYLKSNVKNST